MPLGDAKAGEVKGQKEICPESALGKGEGTGSTRGGDPES